MTPRDPKFYDPPHIELREFRSLLNEKRKRLMSRYQSEHDSVRSAEREVMDAADQGSFDGDMSMMSIMSSRDQQALKEVDAALARIEAGTYGRCDSCGEPIDPERLRALPETRLCSACAALREQEREPTSWPTM